MKPLTQFSVGGTPADIFSQGGPAALAQSGHPSAPFRSFARPFNSSPWQAHTSQLLRLSFPTQRHATATQLQRHHNPTTTRPQRDYNATTTRSQRDHNAIATRAIAPRAVGSVAARRSLRLLMLAAVSSSQTTHSSSFCMYFAAFGSAVSCDGLRGLRGSANRLRFLPPAPFSRFLSWGVDRFTVGAF